MISGIDHLVILVDNLQAAVADYGRLGFTVTPGGQHTGGETHNALVTFADGSYLELLAFAHPQKPSEHRWWAQIAYGEGLIDYALLCSDCSAAIGLDRLRGRVDFDGPFEGGRLRPDGKQIAWRMAVDPRRDTPLPFLIEDVTPRELRVPPEGNRHPNGVLGIEEIVVAVRSLDATTPAYSALLGVNTSEPEYEAELDAVLTRLDVGVQRIVLAQPTSEKSPLHAFLASGRGEGIYAATFVSSIRSGVAMNPALLHGARLSVAMP